MECPIFLPCGEEKQTPQRCKGKMMKVISYLKDAIEKRAAYLHTKAEIENMPLDMALDLDIYRGDADRIARLAVYGKAA
jgi:hypothetical protein